MDTNYLFWKIVANVSGGHIHIYKEIGIWQKNGTGYERKAWWRQPLRYEICQLDESKKSIPTPVHSQKLFVSDGRICFNGGFLKVYDPGLDIDGLADYSQSRAVEGSVTRVFNKVDIKRQKLRFIDVVNKLLRPLPPRQLLDLGQVRETEVCASIRAIQLFAEVCKEMQLHLGELSRLITKTASVKLGKRPLSSPCTDLESALYNVSKDFPKEYDAWIESAISIIKAWYPSVIFYFRGENIRLEVEFESDSAATTSPLFYYPQGKGDPDGTGLHSFGVISLTETIIDNSQQRNVVATISGKEISSSNKQDATTKQYTITGAGHHMLVFFEDRDRSSTDRVKAYFEMLVDAVPIYTSEEMRIDHWFDFLPKEFYIGFNPDTKSVFSGSIERVMFDPNASYPNGT